MKGNTCARAALPVYRITTLKAKTRNIAGAIAVGTLNDDESYCQILPCYGVPEWRGLIIQASMMDRSLSQRNAHTDVGFLVTAKSNKSLPEFVAS